VGKVAACGLDRREGLGLTSLLLLPGLLCDASIWAAQSRDLSTRATISIPEYRSATRLEEMAAITLDLVDGPIAVAAHSMGARVALEMWRKAPERITRLALLDFWVGSVVAGEHDKRKVLTDMSADEGIEAVAKIWVASMVHPDRVNDKALINQLRDMVGKYTHEQHAGQVQALLNRVDLSSLLPTITVPTLIAVGREDPWRTVEQHRQMANAIRGARLEVIDDCGHMSPAERPQVVTELLEEWLDDES
jgi:pimeloyl-ACP methyl ester carboxylesterase